MHKEMRNVGLIMLRNGASIHFAKRALKGGQRSKILETQLSSFTKVKKSQQTKREWNCIQPDNYYSFDRSHQCSSNKNIRSRNKHAIYCQHLSPTFFYSLFYGTADPIFATTKKKRIKIKVHDCCFIFLSIPPTLGKILVLKIKENQSRIFVGETKNRRPIIGWFFPGHTSELLGVCLQ